MRDEQKHIEEMGIIIGRGTDLINEEEELIESTLSYFEFEKFSANSKVISGKGKTLKQALVDASYKTDFELTPGKIQIEMYSEELAKRGIYPILDTLSRDGDIPDIMFLAISKGKAKDIYNTQNQNDIQINMGQYLHDVIKKSSKGKNIFPQVTFSDFLMALNDVGKDPMLPLFDIQEKNIPVITGIAVFKNDKHVGNLPITEIPLINLMEKKIDRITMELSVPKEPFEKYFSNIVPTHTKSLHLGFNIIKGKGKTKLKDKDKLKFETNVELEIALVEMSDQMNLNNTKITNLLEKEMENVLKERFENLLHDLQALGSDALAYGDIYRVHTKGGNLKKEEWHKLYPEIDVDFNINIDIIRHGEHN